MKQLSISAVHGSIWIRFGRKFHNSKLFHHFSYLSSHSWMTHLSVVLQPFFVFVVESSEHLNLLAVDDLNLLLAAKFQRQVLLLLRRLRVVEGHVPDQVTLVPERLAALRTLVSLLLRLWKEKGMVNNNTIQQCTLGFATMG